MALRSASIVAHSRDAKEYRDFSYNEAGTGIWKFVLRRTHVLILCNACVRYHAQGCSESLQAPSCTLREELPSNFRTEPSLLSLDPASVPHTSLTELEHPYHLLQICSLCNLDTCHGRAAKADLRLLSGKGPGCGRVPRTRPSLHRFDIQLGRENPYNH